MLGTVISCRKLITEKREDVLVKRKDSDSICGLQHHMTSKARPRLKEQGEERVGHEEELQTGLSVEGLRHIEQYAKNEDRGK